MATKKNNHPAVRPNPPLHAVGLTGGGVSHVSPHYRGTPPQSSVAFSMVVAPKSNYKTEFCGNGPSCPFGDQCEFAHTYEELQGRGQVIPKAIGQKYRQFPCRSFIMTGTCPYNDRCVFLHDPRVADPEAYTSPDIRKTREDLITKDTFYWPDMLPGSVRSNLDDRDLPSVDQCYIIPQGFRQRKASQHNKGIFSMWNHYADFVTNKNKLAGDKEAKVPYNKFLENTRRLPMLVALAKTPTIPSAGGTTVTMPHKSASREMAVEETKEGLQMSPRDPHISFW